MLIAKFVSSKMNKDEIFSKFFTMLSDIINSRFNWREKILELKVVRKKLKSLFKRFKPKVTIIENSKNVDLMRVDELIDSLQAYEITLSSLSRTKEVVLRASAKDKNEFDDKMSQFSLNLKFLCLPENLKQI